MPGCRIEVWCSYGMNYHQVMTFHGVPIEVVSKIVKAFKEDLDPHNEGLSVRVYTEEEGYIAF